jgi:enoyl-CoA hydratase/carnithine racemase
VEGLNDALDRALADSTVQSVLVHNEGKFFCNGMDLLWIDSHPAEANQLQADAEALMARIVAFPLPTVAAIKGHFTAAGAMLGLSFDVRVMSADHGYFFVPAIDLGLVYSPGKLTQLPASLHQLIACIVSCLFQA